jgi:general secretion pathway protein H
MGAKGTMTSTTGRSSDRGIRGFTLLELILVMLILCISMAVVAPSLRGFLQGAKSRDGALQVLALTRWARAQAASTARVHCLRFDPQAETFHLEVMGFQGYEPVLSGFGRIFTLPEGCLVSVTVAPGSQPNCIRFYPNGRTDGLRILMTGPGTEEAQLVAPSPVEDFRLVDLEGGLQ